MNHDKSRQAFERSCAVSPGGVHSPVRAFQAVGGTPVFLERGEGAVISDIDGNRYVDFCMSWGPLILGHAPAAVVAAVRDAAGRGLSFGTCHEQEAALCEAILRAYPHAERVRLVSSGTEAVMTAVRLARGVTGRPLVLKFEGGYHGHLDSLLVKAGSGLVTLGTASSAGVPEAIAGTTLVAPFDDLEAVDALFEAHGKDIACVTVEPIPANNGLLVQSDAWLSHLRALCDRHGALLHFDEVITGFRLRFGGVGPLVGVEPDLVTLGKIIGGGMPIGALTGRGSLLDRLAPLGDVYQAGTLSGNPVSVAAGLATLERLEDGSVHARLEELGARLQAALTSSTAAWPQVQRKGSILWPYLSSEALPTRADRIDPVAIARFAKLHGAMLERGYYLPPSGHEVLFLSAAHGEADVDGLAAALLEEVAGLE